ncbi:PREDICTED: uncharacterized protein LOC109586818 [Amphimedon queenslandica]|uniref:Inositol polyphosphate-related phosphatase domain-containing protein n=1 Tax=Amphimedon queenslandica TaxID=400682 RepID=A0AAN0JP71_AMPQE|nr:PREDICTED: uncharacterized protein LOC109586818 [Amphimedon queenslandica]|eukprot:XP_019858595.1 PREDICTED: uncharacterized protein LOC109586818 [Amphimedon queenslandica]
MSRVSVQQLLRPTDTCLFMIRGKLLGVNSNEERVIGIVKHEGTAEHALFVFQVDHLGSLSIHMLLPIYGMFTSVFRSSTPAGCHVEINFHGETYVFLLPYDTHTALFFSQLTLAKDKYLSSIKAGVSPVEFQWLDGYQMCRTGWDRFSKPSTTSTPGGGAGGGANTEEIQSGFPDNWPWGHIITPRPDGRTDLAMCESYEGRGQGPSIDEFDPLRNNTSSLSPPSCVVTMETSTPQSMPRLPYDPPVPPGADPRGPPLLIPFDKPVRPCLSETNISQLQLEHRLATPLGLSPLASAQSQETLDDCVIRRRSVKESTPSPGNLTPRFSRERPQGFHLMPSPSSEITNPFNKEGVAQEDEVWRRKEVEDEANFFLVNSFSELEMTPTAHPDRKGSGSSIKRTASLDDLDERRPVDSYEVLDYKQRRMRQGGSIASSTANTIGGGVETRPLPVPASVPKNMSHRSPHHISAPTVTSQSISSPQTKSNKFHGKKSKSPGAAPVDGNSKWVSRYHPGVLLLKGSMRDCLIQRELHERENDFCVREPLTLFCGTWNVNGQYPIQRVDKWLVYQETIPDIFAIGFQELDLSPEALLRNETSREEPWIDLVESSLKMAGKFKKISVVRLVGILLLVYVKEELVPHVSSVDYNYVPCGLVGGHFGNKGGVAIRFNIYHSSVCIVNTHLAAHIDEVEKRNQNYHDIYDKISFFKDSELSYRIMDHNFIIWMGDLNYRIQTSVDFSTEIIKALADLYQFNKLLQHDQLQQQQRRGEAFTHFKEPPIDFKPTYKFDPSTNSWDSSEKNRAPAWCDRILYYCDDMSHIKNLSYLSHPEMIISDHKPVSATFELQVS